MTSTVFEWDDAKAKANFKKHGILFQVAAQVFDDPFHIATQDRFEQGEHRWQTIGMAEGYLVLLVAHTTRQQYENDFIEVVRIISARPATKQERKRYEHHGTLHP